MTGWRGDRPSVGSLAGELDLTGDWDSPQTNAEVAADFGMAPSAAPPGADAMALAIVDAMTATTMQLDASVRDELAEIARQDFAGVPLAEALRRLIREHRVNKIMARYAELRSDPQEWASYRAEAALTDNVAGDGVPPGRDEYPEYNQ